MSALTETQINTGRRLLDQGATWTAIAARLGTTIHSVQSALKPGYWERRREKERARVRHYTRKPPDGTILGHHEGLRSVTPAEAVRALATVPADTRGLTERLLGDPLPGRSALAKRGKNNPATFAVFHGVFPANNSAAILAIDRSRNPVALGLEAGATG